MPTEQATEHTEHTEHTEQNKRKRGRPAGTSKAPCVKPDPIVTVSPCGTCITYISWKKGVLKNGNTVYHKHTTRRIRNEKVNGVFKRPNRQKNEARVKAIQKRKLVNAVKNYLFSDDFDVERLHAVCAVLNVPCH